MLSCSLDHNEDVNDDDLRPRQRKCMNMYTADGGDEPFQHVDDDDVNDVGGGNDDDLLER